MNSSSTSSSTSITSSTKKYLWPAIGLGYLLFFSLLLAWARWTEAGKIKEQLQWLSPLFLEIIFVLMIISIILNAKAMVNLVVQKFKSLDLGNLSNLSKLGNLGSGISPHRQDACATGGAKVVGIVILAICILGTLIGGLAAAFLPARTHRIYYDEDIYLHIGQSIACERKAAMCAEGHIEYGQYQCLRTEYNKEPNAWPYLIGLAFRIFGVNEVYGHILNNLLYGLSFLIVFLMAILWFDDLWAGIYSSLIFGLIPQNLVWANTASAEFPAAFFAGLAVLGAMFFCRQKNLTGLFLLITTLSFGIQFRPESFLIVPVVGLILIFEGKDIWKKDWFYAGIALFLLLILPHLMHLWTVREHNWDNPQGHKFSLAYFPETLKTNGFYYLDNQRFPVIFSLFFLAGLLINKLWSRRVTILLWFLGFWGIFLFFYAGSYRYGANVRFSILSNLPLALLSGFSLSEVVKWCQARLPRPGLVYGFSLFILFFSFISFLPSVRAVTPEGWGARADHKYAREMAEMLPEDSIVLTHNPNMFLLWGKSAAQGYLATHDQPYMDHLFERFTDGVYFHFNFWCNIQCPEQNNVCDEILKLYKPIVIKGFKERTYRYVLYKLKPKEETEKK